jgi:hypothetical protein
MDDLPDDLKSKIFQELDALHLCRLSAVSKSTGIIASNPESWKIVHGSSKDEAKKIYLKNFAKAFQASCNIERCKAELAIATTLASDASKELERIGVSTLIRYEDVDSCKWNTYSAAVSELNFAEERMEEAETNLEGAELEHWRLNGIAKEEVRKVKVPLRLRKIADDALTEWKLADAAAAKKMNPVFAGYLSSGEKVGWEEVFEKERSTWWIARKAFREISLWEGKVSAPDILMEISAK